MSVEDIITLDDGKEFMILDIVDHGGEKYLYSVEVDEEENPKTNFQILRLIVENNEEFIETVNDKDVINKILPIITANFLNSKDEEQEG